MKKQTQFNPLDYLLFEGVTGSNLYGTATADSDTDTRGVCLPPMKVLIDPFHKFEVQDSGFEEEDRAIYDLGKFFKLCADGNPNIVELLFVPQEKTLFTTMTWENVLKNRNLFLSKKVKYTFTGYAFAQLKRVKNHRVWFINPPKEKPTREDYGLTSTPLLSGDNLQALQSLPVVFLDSNVAVELGKEKAYGEEMRRWKNYISWKENRNPKRRELEDKFGYDTKYVAHIFRLMSEGKELLLTGNITFPLPNADEIMEIRNGKYRYEEVIELATDMEQEFETWYNKSPLPNSPDIKGITELYYEMLGV